MVDNNEEDADVEEDPRKNGAAQVAINGNDAMGIDSDDGQSVATVTAAGNTAAAADADGDNSAAPTPTPSSPATDTLSISAGRGAFFKRGGRGGRGRGGRARSGMFVSAPTTMAASARTSPGKGHSSDEDDSDDDKGVAQSPALDRLMSAAAAPEVVPPKPARSRKAQEFKALKRQRDHERAAELDACVLSLLRLFASRVVAVADSSLGPSSLAGQRAR